MNNDSYGNQEELSDIAAIQKRPGLYLGGTGFFGYVQYLVSAFDLLLEHGATWIEVNISGHLCFTSDANIPVCLDENYQVQPFEAFGPLIERHLPNATILTALSESFNVVLSDGITETTLQCGMGERQVFEQRPAANAAPSIQMKFFPFLATFSTTDISPTVLHSYCRRTACLYPGVSIRVRAGGEVAQYHSEDGIADLFEAVATPYQILHKPIQISESQGKLKVQAMFAFHSWSENKICSFVNRGRVPDRGTHETGLINAITQFYNHLQKEHPVGTLAILAIEYPDVTYEGCIKSRIGNPELITLVNDLVSMGIERWVARNPKEVEQLKTIERFQFAAAW